MQLVRRSWFVVACGFGLLIGSTAQAQPTKLLPNDTEMIVTFNLQQILGSEVIKSNKAILDLVKGQLNQQLEDKGVAKHLKTAGFDLFTDLHSVTLAMPGGRDPKETFVVVQGKFDAEKIEAAAMAAAKDDGSELKFVTIAKVKALEVTPKNEQPVYIGILDKKTMIACASKADFTEAVGRLTGTMEAKFKADAVKALLKTINAKQSISVLSTSALLAKLAEGAPQAGGAQAKQALDVLKQTDGLSAAITIQKDIDFQVGVNAKDNDTASKYADAANLGMGLAKMQVAQLAKQNEKLAPAADIMNTIKISAQGANILVRGQISFENLQKLLENLPIPMN